MYLLSDLILDMNFHKPWIKHFFPFSARKCLRTRSMCVPVDDSHLRLYLQLAFPRVPSVSTEQNHADVPTTRSSLPLLWGSLQGLLPAPVHPQQEGQARPLEDSGAGEGVVPQTPHGSPRQARAMCCRRVCRHLGWGRGPRERVLRLRPEELKSVSGSLSALTKHADGWLTHQACCSSSQSGGWTSWVWCRQGRVLVQTPHMAQSGRENKLSPVSLPEASTLTT